MPGSCAGLHACRAGLLWEVEYGEQALSSVEGLGRGCLCEGEVFRLGIVRFAFFEAGPFLRVLCYDVQSRMDG
jgi:hypothetical protein